MNVPVTPEGGLTFEDGLSGPQVCRAESRHGRHRADFQLPAAEQPLQRLEPDARRSAGLGLTDAAPSSAAEHRSSLSSREAALARLALPPRTTGARYVIAGRPATRDRSNVQETPDCQSRRHRLPYRAHAARDGVQSIAVHSDADAGSLHVAQADKAYCLVMAPRTIPTSRRTNCSTPRATPAPTRSIPATASCRRMPPSRRPAWPPASPSVGPTPEQLRVSA